MFAQDEYLQRDTDRFPICVVPIENLAPGDKMDALELTKDRHWEREQKTWSRQGLGGTDGGSGLIARFFDPQHKVTQETLVKLRSNKGFKGPRRVILDMDEEKLTYLLMYYGLCAVGNDEPYLSTAMRVLGKGIEDEAYGDALKAWDDAQARKFEELVRRNNSSLRHRKRAIAAYARRAKFTFKEWTDDERLAAGKTAMEILLAGPMFALDDQFWTITVGARESLDDLMSALVMRLLIGLPQTGPVEPWREFKLHIGGYPYSLVRTHQKAVRRHVEVNIRDGVMTPALEALNHAQSVLWRIDADMLALVRQCYEMGVPVDGLPSKDDLPEPPKGDWDEMSADQRMAWKKKAHSVKMANIGLIGEQTVLNRDLAWAEQLVGKDFHTPMNFDYRGRVYPIAFLNYARQDYVRAMFKFAEGQIVNDEGMYWLKVHLANVGDFNKVSKAPFDDRVAWTNENLEFIRETANAPLDNLMWTKADKPFMFVAACKALVAAECGQPVHIPNSWDGSCSGLQHLCSMSRSTEGALVNLLPNDRPQDIYQTVADIVKAKVEADLGGENDELAKQALAYGINRSLVKRNVMTYSYSSKKYGMQNQLVEDTMRPLQSKVLTGELEKHPFGDDNGFKASRYLGGYIFAAIEEAISKPAEVMRYLQTIARVMAHEGKPVTWVTPMGFPVMLRYPKQETKQLQLFLVDKGLKRSVYPATAIETNEIDKYRAANAVAPSFVHSMDSCHLQMVVRECAKAGINSIALVHDSFGCLPNDAPRFREIIKRTFVELYTENDVLQDILETSISQLERSAYKLDPVPHKGDLDLALVMQAEYAFA
jgi:DNA-directed RNA polymerase